MADADRVLVPLSRRAFDLYATSLPFGPNYGDAEFITAFRVERGGAVGAVFGTPRVSRADIATEIPDARVDGEWQVPAPVAVRWPNSTGDNPPEPVSQMRDTTAARCR